MTVTGIATSQTVTLSSGGSCTYSQMTVTPNGNVDVTCATSAGPGTFGIVVPLNMATGSTTTGTQARITRSSGTAGAVDVSFALSGSSSCTSSTPSPVSFGAGEGGSKGIIISAGASPGTCVIGITPTAGTVSGGGTATITVVDGDADVVFAFATGTYPANVGSSPTTITVTRTGGPNGAWDVPYTLSGLFPGSFSATKFTFLPNVASASITYSPPTATPASPALPANLTLTLGTPTPGTTPPPAASQNGTLGATTVATLTLNGPAVGCPAPENSVTTLGANGFINHQRVPSGVVVTYVLPSAGLVAGNGVFGLYATSYTYPIAPLSTEIHINKCKGLVQATNDGCYINGGTGALQKVEKIWMTTTTAKYSTPAQFAAAGRCYAPPSQGPWYINVKHTYSGCQTAGFCGWHAVWKDYSS